MPDLFHDSTKSIPTSDSQIVRVNMEEDEIQGQKDHLPGQNKSDILNVQHVPSKGK